MAKKGHKFKIYTDEERERITLEVIEGKKTCILLGESMILVGKLLKCGLENTRYPKKHYLSRKKADQNQIYLN